ncbi:MULTISPECIES: ABC transporter ATP-binding protein [Terrisporobacter]|uniref:Cobalt ABC transporter ATP-binding protein n=1 Tax=Terrisporobacter othiniensis TaxID=1577792 RepID=A0A0B3W460_9FIRM|nr:MULTISPECIES: ATP-binding cassette domain-containing protein [Terrisporobacter]KHS57202.1 cobalt ABC transporter ATP-binding protein [Terrisporobacter othiniensis]MCC3668493.1 ATP-binding cassette domain-containing protein [Terrisporobacter mayombei]
METFRVEQLAFSYPNIDKQALKNIDLTIESGEFVVICGKSGCGKSTLIRHLKTVLTPYGKREGKVYFKGRSLDIVDDRTQSSEIGYVLQSPENQIVTDKVWHELAFGLESLGYDNKTIRLRVAEMASFFGIQTWFGKNVTELSGGQKQLLNLASIMVMQPSALILDEPTSQLDPITASDFLKTIKKINEELGITIVMVEHDLEEVFNMADRIILMDEGEIIIDDKPKNIGGKVKQLIPEMFEAMPSPIKIASSLNTNETPITVKEGRYFINELFSNEEVAYTRIEDDKENNISEEKAAIKMKDVWFKYEKDGNDVLKDLNFEVKSGEFFCVVGGNGTGKSTTVSLICGIRKPYRGKIEIFGKNIQEYKNKELFDNNLAILPQDPQALFVKNTVEKDLYEMLPKFGMSKKEKAEKVAKVARLVEIENLLNHHPYDLSGGEQQRAALAKVLLLEPKLLILDEPTKGLDAHFKVKFAKMINKLIESKVTVVMVSHDIEFCASYAHRCALFFDGNIVTSNTPNKFFSGNSFYTTVANRMSRQVFENAVTCEDVITLCKGNKESVLQTLA